MYGDNRLGGAVSHEADPDRHQDQVSDGGGHKELEERLGPTEVEAPSCINHASMCSAA